LKGHLISAHHTKFQNKRGTLVRNENKEQI